MVLFVTELSLSIAIVLLHLGWIVVDWFNAHRHRNHVGYLAMMRYHPTQAKKTAFYVLTFTVALLAIEAGSYGTFITLCVASSVSIAWVHYRHAWASRRLHILTD